MNAKIEEKRSISIRVTQEEFVDIYKQYEFSGCKSLTHYLTRVLKERGTADKLTDHYQIELLTALKGFILRLDYITDLLITMKLSRPPSLAEMERWAMAIISTIDSGP
jgi:hypothetical protein